MIERKWGFLTGGPCLTVLIAIVPVCRVPFHGSLYPETPIEGGRIPASGITWGAFGVCRLSRVQIPG